MTTGIDANNSSNKDKHKEREREEEEENGLGGVIRDGKVSGRIPCGNECFAVHYPGYPSSTDRAIQTLGGPDAILKARGADESQTSNSKLELYFRPEDPYSHPISANIQPSNSLLLKFSKKQSQSNQLLSAHIVAQIPQAFHFQGMADYQHVIPVHAEKARRKKRKWAELDQPHFEKAGLLDLDHEDVMILVPPLFSPKDIPENIALRPPHAFSSKKKQEEATGSHFEIPKQINWKEYTEQSSLLWQWQMAVAELFEERPIWPKGSLTERLLDKNLKFSFQTLKRLLLTVAYYFSGGPFLRFWIRKGYDPRKDPDSRIYQRIDFRVPPPLRSSCEANAATSLKHRWEDLCKFRVFPHKCQVSLQLYELDDEYIQQEIRKPPKQATCTYGTGWFSSHVHDSFRNRLMVRFLSVYPGTGAEKLLKAASEDFAKSKRACIYKDTLKPGEEEVQQTNREDTGDEARENENRTDDAEVDEADENENRTDDAEVDEAESDDPEEELDEYEALDLGGENGEISLDPHSCILLLFPSSKWVNIENNSRNRLQELFGSFASMDPGGDKLQDDDSSDGEYEIYEQDIDETYPDDEDD
ncbi:hypothetical protein Tsubulata_008306 [Turnera subulata]|uniref:Transcription factor IIIC subunit 5 HTH domain-containing protein n=1 Tax=Turnera subulata TaxID=218843 RepID=A0A9Q0FX27_9ROSI|nr:hypothetical protein Tsubulata_008306 [Turnera subulata]